MSANLKLPKTYKTLLMLALVIGPFFWLAFTEDGQWRTDLALIALLGKPDFNAALDAFDSRLTESKLRESFPKLEFQCAVGANPFGNRLCGAEIGTFNQIPAASVTLFFQDDQLRAAKVVYRRVYHAMVRDWIDQRVGARSVNPLAAPVSAQEEGVIAQPVADGLLLMREGELTDDDEPALIWLSQAAI
ncbi:hypothetical protein [Allochromatium palmeri]|uniref:Uncharacterized protein n=1 Tax=Allochromatium palmeri TaxID=231048 RepID=A0A6N8E944_9GAMM|nr:hypothetical protein [Allochromatium palmeri]MTW20803.1 hypothetical protein [Allochromatium palmeri]